MSLPRRGGKWDLGESHRSRLVSMSYQLKVNVSIKSRKSARTFACPPIPISLVASSAEDRAVALASAGPEKKRHRSSRRGLYMHEGHTDLSQISRARKASRSVSPIHITGVATDVKPILLPSGHPSQPQSISFMFPSPPPQGGSRVLLPIQSLVHPSSSDGTQLPSPPPTRSGTDADVWRRVQETGRRISTTTSEEDEVQPSRSRQKTHAADNDRAAGFPRPSLPSLDALGLGLPHVPDAGRPIRRPRTAPVHSTFSMQTVPPPLSGFIAPGSAQRPLTSMGRMPSGKSVTSTVAEQEPFAFAFSSNANEEDEGEQPQSPSKT